MAKKSTQEYRSEMTLHLTRMSSDLEHIREKVDANFEHLEKVNGRLNKAENNITGIKAVGLTFYTVIGVVLTWFGIQK